MGLLLVFLVVSIVSNPEEVTDCDWSEPWLKATVKLTAGHYSENGLELGSTAATGFMVQLSDEYGNNTYPVIITAKHVYNTILENSSAIYILLYSEELGRIEERGCYYHINDDSEFRPVMFVEEENDAIAFFLDTTKVINPRYVRPLLNPFSTENLVFARESNLSLGYSVAVLGYPGSVLNCSPWMDRPLYTSGAVAWLPANNFTDQSHMNFLIDIPVYKGHSGSPVIGHAPFDPMSITFSSPQFVGIVVSSILESNENGSVNAGLSKVIPADIIVELLNHLGMRYFNGQ